MREVVASAKHVDRLIELGIAVQILQTAILLTKLGITNTQPDTRQMDEVQRY